MEKDIISGVTRFGPERFSSMLVQYNIINSTNLKIIGMLSKYLPPKIVSIILVEVLANNIKDVTGFHNFIAILGNVSSLLHLYNKKNIILG